MIQTQNQLVGWKCFNPAKVSNSSQKIVAQYNFTLPEWVAEKRDCSIDVTKSRYGDTVYCATIWWFNRGVAVVKSSDNCITVIDCINLARTRVLELSRLLIECR